MAELPFLDESTAAAPAVPFSGIVNLGSGPAPSPYIGTLDANSFEIKSNKGEPNGYAGLDAGGKISLSLLPDANALESEAIAFAIALG